MHYIKSLSSIVISLLRTSIFLSSFSFWFWVEKSFSINIKLRLHTKYGFVYFSCSRLINRTSNNIHHSNSRYFCLWSIVTLYNFHDLGLLFGRWCLDVHQEYRTCGSACPLTCSDVRHARYFRLCPSKCVQGCFCKRGFTRRSHRKSQCIPDWRCWLK